MSGTQVLDQHRVFTVLRVLTNKRCNGIGDPDKTRGIFAARQ